MNALKRNPDDPMTAIETGLAERIITLEAEVEELLGLMRATANVLRGDFPQTAAILDIAIAKHQ